jgi:prevent-host-death family protein
MQSMGNWTLQDAKARFSALVGEALSGVPQRVTRHGKDAVVVVRASDYDRLTRPKESLVEFFARSPHRDVKLRIVRSKDLARDIDL